MTTDTRAAVVDALSRALGPGDVTPAEQIDDRYLRDWVMALSSGAPAALVRPRTTEDVSTVLRLCHERNIVVVPQGGRTGLVGGATPVDGAVIISLERMTGIEELDPAGSTMTVRAGTPLQTVQEAAQQAGLFFPLDLGARGSCHIGGTVATNAGGNRVIRYGMTRDLVLGLEVVLADGTIVTSLNTLIKNNAGLDIRQIFIGSEGTLGIITRVVLRLYPAPRSTCTAMVAAPDYDRVVALLRHAQAALGGTLSAFEMMWPDFYTLMTTQVPGMPQPLPLGSPAYVLIEALGSEPEPDLARFERMLETAAEADLLTDAVVAQSPADARAFWTVRDGSGDFPRIGWPGKSFDIGIPTARIGAFVEACKADLQARWSTAETAFFGHIGDSNLHLHVKVRDGEQPQEEIEEVVYGTVRAWSGTVSAEHGIGVIKRRYLGHSRSPQEIAVMRAIKHALDPKGLLNPGKVL
ncbi:MAG TPA: FAD-binding oxidoreductase [Vicinamibacterales bacterium]|jgi:FAD/FMN-containing dehydrogenase|nr:FAD-binding oxidoreductase [Vicinamibacterales bacterium]